MAGALITLLLAAMSAPGGGAPNVVFISVDTLRADHLGCYGYGYDTSPCLDRLAARARLFEDCATEVPLTNPAFCAMQTSHVPRTLGTFRNGLSLGKDVPTVAEQFLTAGYQTFCVQSNWTLRAKLSGLERGYETYDDHFTNKRWGLFKNERYADDVTDIALKFLEQRAPGKPFFCWIHYSDPHAPYRFHHRYNPWDGVHRHLNKEERARKHYDSEIAFMDHEIGRLLDALPQENTYILFTADHGESLYEHGYLGHGRRIYQDGIHIPLFFAGPGIQPERTPAPARGLDIGPTLLALAGLPPVPGMQGMNLLNETPPLDRVRVIETYGGAVPHLPGAKLILKGRPPQRQGVLDGPWKLILHDDLAELYNLDSDPGELHNRASEEPEQAARLRALVEQWNGAHLRSHTEGAAISEEDQKALKSGGYL